MLNLFIHCITEKENYKSNCNSRNDHVVKRIMYNFDNRSFNIQMVSKWYFIFFFYIFTTMIFPFFFFFFNKNELERTCAFRKREDNLLFSKLLIVKNCSSHVIVRNACVYK